MLCAFSSINNADRNISYNNDNRVQQEGQWLPAGQQTRLPRVSWDVRILFGFVFSTKYQSSLISTLFKHTIGNNWFMHESSQRTWFTLTPNNWLHLSKCIECSITFKLLNISIIQSCALLCPTIRDDNGKTMMLVSVIQLNNFILNRKRWHLNGTMETKRFKTLKGN